MTHTAAPVTVLLRRSVAVLTSALLMSLALSAAPAEAAVLGGVIKSVTTSSTTGYQPDRTLSQTMTFCVPDGTQQGDTFTLLLPKQITSNVPVSFPLPDAAGQTVANASRSATAPYTFTFTMTDYAQTHLNVCGEASFTGKLVSTVTPGQPLDLAYTANDGQVFHNVVTPTAPPAYDTTSPNKIGQYTDDTDQGRTQPDGAIWWRLYTPNGASSKTVITDDSTDPTWMWKCSTPIVYQIGTYSSTGSFTSEGAYTGSRNVSCTPDRLVITLGAIPDGKGVYVRPTASFVGATGTGGHTIGNSATFATTTPAGTTSKFARASTNQSSGSGSGQGVAPAPAVSIVNGDDQGNASDIPADAAPLGTEPGSAALVITVTNTGSDPLHNLTVTDTVAGTNGTVTGLTCDFSAYDGPTSGTTSGTAVVPVGGQVPCTATLTGVTSDSIHNNTASVTGQGVFSGSTTTDANVYYAAAEPAVIPAAAVSVGDFVWSDSNRNGVQDPGEPGIGGVRLTITGPGGDPVTKTDGSVAGTATTAADGSYLFNDLPALPAGQHYTVRVVQSGTALDGYSPTAPGLGGDPAADSSTGSAQSGDLTADGDTDRTLDFGYVVPIVSVGDRVWRDSNANGIQDNGEPGLGQVTLTLAGPDGKAVTDVYGDTVGPVVSGPLGAYYFTNLPALAPGDHYTVTVDQRSPGLAGLTPTRAHAGDDEAVDSSTGSEESGDLTGNNNVDSTLDFGYVTAAVSVGDLVWLDTNHDGLHTDNEPGLGDVGVFLSAPDQRSVVDVNGQPVVAQRTAADGSYLFENLPALPAGQHYIVSIDTTSQALNGLISTKDGVGDDRSVDSSTETALSSELTGQGDFDRTLDFGYIAPAVSVGDFVWQDTNRDGIQDPGEPGISNVRVGLTGPDGNAVTDNSGKSVASARTDNQGRYLFADLPTLPDGQHYTATVDGTSAALTGLISTVAAAGTDREVDSSTGTAESGDLSQDGAQDRSLDFGFFPAAVSVGDFVWFDTDTNGLQGSTEPGIVGVKMTLTGPDGQPVTSVTGETVGAATTDATGHYLFSGLPPLPAGQHYTVTVGSGSAALDGLEPTTPGTGIFPDIDSSTGSAESGDLTADGASDLRLDFGYVTAQAPAVSVGNFVWRDRDADGIQDADEPGIEGVSVTISGPGIDKPYSQFTDPSGRYSFRGLPTLPAGQHYTVTIAPGSPYLSDLVPTKAGVGDDRGLDSSTGSAESGDLTGDGASDLSLDFGFVAAPPPAAVSVGDFVWRDTDHDGVQDSGEPGIGGVTVTLTVDGGHAVSGVNRVPVQPQVTGDDGSYRFAGLPPLPAGQHYTVDVDATSPALAGLVPTRAGVGDDTSVDSSTRSAESGDLTGDGDADLTLDFGYATPTTAAISVVKSDGDGHIGADPDHAVNLGPVPASTTLRYIVTNTGNEDLNSVDLTDTVSYGAQPGTLTCKAPEPASTPVDGFIDSVTVQDGSAQTVRLKGLLRVGQAFTCTAPLTDVRAAGHADVATARGTGDFSGAATSASGAFFATVVTRPALTITKGDSDNNPADTADTAADLTGSGGAADLRIVVSNSGDEPMSDLSVTDRVISNGQVDGLTCDFAALGGPATGTTWAGPLAPGASFTCAAALNGVEAGDVQHQDTATVAGVGTVAGQTVSASNDYFAAVGEPGLVLIKGDADGRDANTRGQAADLGRGTGSADLVLVLGNSGSEALRDVTVKDRVLANGKVTGLACDFSDFGGPVSATRWAGPLPAGALVECTATLRHVKAGRYHHDTATVSATGVDSGASVRASDSYWAHTTTRAHAPGGQPGSGDVTSINSGVPGPSGTSPLVWVGAALLALGVAGAGSLVIIGRRKVQRERGW